MKQETEEGHHGRGEGHNDQECAQVRVPCRGRAILEVSLAATAVGHGDDKVEKLKPNKERRITVRFNADTAATMQWNFRPQQSEVTLYAGETALAFYTVVQEMFFIQIFSKTKGAET